MHILQVLSFLGTRRVGTGHKLSLSLINPFLINFVTCLSSSSCYLELNLYGIGLVLLIWVVSLQHAVFP